MQAFFSVEAKGDGVPTLRKIKKGRKPKSQKQRVIIFDN